MGPSTPIGPPPPAKPLPTQSSLRRPSAQGLGAPRPSGTAPPRRSSASHMKRGPSLYQDDPELLEAYLRGHQSVSPRSASRNVDASSTSAAAFPPPPAETPLPEVGQGLDKKIEDKPVEKEVEEPQWRLVDPMAGHPEVREMRISGGEMVWILENGATGRIKLEEIDTAGPSPTLVLGDKEQGFCVIGITRKSSKIGDPPLLVGIPSQEAADAFLSHLLRALEDVRPPAGHVTPAPPPPAPPAPPTMHTLDGGPALDGGRVVVIRRRPDQGLGIAFEGTVVTGVEAGKPGDVAGVRAGEKVTRIKGGRVHTFEGLANAVKQCGDEFTMELVDGTTSKRREGNKDKVVKVGVKKDEYKKDFNCFDCAQAGWGSQRCWGVRVVIIIVMTCIAFIAVSTNEPAESCSLNVYGWLWVNVIVMTVVLVLTMTTGKILARIFCPDLCGGCGNREERASARANAYSSETRPGGAASIAGIHASPRSSRIRAVHAATERQGGEPDPEAQFAEKEWEQEQERSFLHLSALTISGLLVLWGVVWLVAVTRLLINSRGTGCGDRFSAVAAVTASHFAHVVVMVTVFVAMRTAGGDKEAEADPLTYRRFSPPRGRDKRAGRRVQRMAYELPDNYDPVTHPSIPRSHRKKQDYLYN
eukprot:Hpha_TRINITY_DN15705_c2_g11::TRINITY_DN15705_c2_g11_i1::g.42100::m.42100